MLRRHAADIDFRCFLSPRHYAADTRFVISSSPAAFHDVKYFALCSPCADFMMPPPCRYAMMFSLAAMARHGRHAAARQGALRFDIARHATMPLRFR